MSSINSSWKRVGDHPEAADSAFKPGDRVRHPVYGEGTVVTGWTIDFDTAKHGRFNRVTFTTVARDNLTRIEPPSDTVTIPRMTEAEAREWYIGLRWRSVTSGSYESAVVGALQSLGIIRDDETPLERFQRETGHTVTDDARPAVEAALAWSAAS